jgi:hypothetical protein
VYRADLYRLELIAGGRREQKVFHLTMLSVVAYTYSTTSALGTTTKQWWKYAEEKICPLKHSTFRAEPVTVQRTCPFLVRYTLILLVRVERIQMCGLQFVTTGSFPVFRRVRTENALSECRGRTRTLRICKVKLELHPLQIKVTGLGGYFLFVIMTFQ